MDSRKAQVFWMRPRNPMPDDPMALFQRAATISTVMPMLSLPS